MSSISTLRLRPARQAEIPAKATWSYCLAKCHLERGRPDFAWSQLKAIEVYYNHERHMKLIRQRIEPFNPNGIRSRKVQCVTPQQLIHPAYFSEDIYQEYRQRRRSKKAYREHKQRERYAKIIANSSKTTFEVLSELRISQINRRKEVEERASYYVSEVVQKGDEMKVEFEVKSRSSTNHAQQLFELQQQKCQLQRLQQDHILAEQQKQYQAQQQQEYQLRLLQHQQHEEYQRQLYVQQQHHRQLQQQRAQQAHQLQRARQMQHAQQLQTVQEAQPARQSWQPRPGTRSRSNARSLGSTPPVITPTPIAWVVEAAAKISALQNTPKESVCPEVEMADVFFPMAVEEDRMDFEIQEVVAEDDKMIIDEFDPVKSDTDTECVMMEVGSDDEDEIIMVD